jgi:hypothetical protein
VIVMVGVLEAEVESPTAELGVLAGLAGLDVEASFGEQVDELRGHDTEAVRALRAGLVAAQRRLHVRELAALRVLDERDALSRFPERGVSSKTSKTERETARALESLPAVAEQARRGELSNEQLVPLAQLATPETDAEWAARGPNLAPIDLNAMVRRRKTVTAEDARARRDARECKSWPERDTGMWAGRWRLPDVDGSLVERVLDHLAEQMKPATGEPWDSLAHRKADALVELCTKYADVELTGKWKYQIVIHRRADGSVDCDGMGVAPATLDAMVLNATVRDRVDDAHGQALHTGRGRSGLRRAVERTVIERDPHCRVYGCSNTRGLQIHHLVPHSLGGCDDVANLARVCPYHHRMLVPHGPSWLVGDPNQLDGLTIVHQDDLPDPRAGPSP